MDRPADTDHVFGAKLVRQFMYGTIWLRGEDHLSNTLAVTQVNKDQSPVVSTAVDPAQETGWRTDMLFSQLCTGMWALHQEYSPYLACRVLVRLPARWVCLAGRE